jgi:hypothetical protein
MTRHNRSLHDERRAPEGCYRGVKCPARAAAARALYAFARDGSAPRPALVAASAATDAASRHPAARVWRAGDARVARL